MRTAPLCARVVAVLAVLAVPGAVGGCSGDAATPRDSDPTAPPSSAATSSPQPVAVTAFQTFAGLTIPSQATSVKVTGSKDANGEPTYRARFRVPAATAQGFCTQGGLGGWSGADVVSAQLRKEFGYAGPDAGTATCSASLPSDVQIQRRVLMSGIDSTTVTVQVIAFRMPAR